MRLRALTLTAALMAGLWLACGDDYQENGPLTGDTGAKCFPDETCKAGLLCLSGLCVAPPDSGASSSSSSGDASEAGVRDAGNEGLDSGDADVDSGCGDVDTTGVFAGVVCDDGLRCPQGAFCCATANEWSCTTKTSECVAPDVFLINCDSPGDCAADQRCCFTVDHTTTKCAYGQVSNGTCAASCPPSMTALCDPSHPCATTGQCTDRTLMLKAGTRLLRRGLCELP